jgi:hypothetical protein
LLHALVRLKIELLETHIQWTAIYLWLCEIFYILSSQMSITVSERSKAWSSIAGIVGSNPIQSHGCMCVRLFYVCFVLSVGSGLSRRAHQSPKEFYRQYKNIENLKKMPASAKGCSATDEVMKIFSDRRSVMLYSHGDYNFNNYYYYYTFD